MNLSRKERRERIREKEIEVWANGWNVRMFTSTLKSCKILKNWISFRNFVEITCENLDNSFLFKIFYLT